MHTTCHVCLAPLGDPVLDTRSPFSLTSLCLRHTGPTLVHLCAACGHAWQSVFDIAGFFWNEIHVRGRRLLQEIDLLARTYGWTEGEILGMTDQRRSLYVGMALS